MRKFNLMAIALFAMLLVPVSCSSSQQSSPSEVGSQVFNVLKKFDITNRRAFERNFPTIQELRNLGKNDKLTSDQQAKNEITSYPKDEWTKQLTKSYNEIDAIGSRNNVNWQSITLSDFVYEVTYKSGIKYVEGELTINHRGDELKFVTYSVWDGRKYLLLQISDYY